MSSSLSLSILSSLLSLSSSLLLLLLVSLSYNSYMDSSLHSLPNLSGILLESLTILIPVLLPIVSIYGFICYSKIHNTLLISKFDMFNQKLLLFCQFVYLLYNMLRYTYFYGSIAVYLFTVYYFYEIKTSLFISRKF